MPRLDPAAQRRLESCLTLAKRGATAGERAAAKAAAERIAATAGLTLAEAQEHTATTRRAAPPSDWTPPPGWQGWARPRAKPSKPRRPPKPPTVADRLREKAEEAAAARKRAAAADHRFSKDYAEHAAWEAEQRVAQAKRDHDWAESRATAA
jgi:hypothetical protein